MQRHTIRILFHMPEVEFIMLACVMQLATPQGLKCGPHHRLPSQLLLSILGTINMPHCVKATITPILAIPYRFLFHCAFVLFELRR